MTSGERCCCASPLSSLPGPNIPRPPSQCMHIPQPHACVLQTAVKQSRLEYVTACNAALGYARCLLPLRTEGKEIINRFELRTEQQRGRGRRRGGRESDCASKRKRKLSSRIFWMKLYFHFTLKLLNTS